MMYLIIISCVSGGNDEVSLQSVDDTGNVSEDGQQDVDEEVGIATALKEDTQRREDDGKDDLADIAGSLEQNVVSVSAERAEDRGMSRAATYERHGDFGGELRS
jgi:hypothetical protein